MLYRNGNKCLLCFRTEIRMNEFMLTCCSTADMPEEFFQSRNIAYVPFHFTMDGVTYPDDLGKSVPYDQFFDRIARGSMPTTSQVNVQEYLEFWEPFLKEGKDVLHISLSSGISGSFNSASIAAAELREKYPDRKMLVVDSLAASSGYGLFMDLLADRRDQGMNIDDLHSWAEENKLKVHHWFFSSDLTSYFRGGRISHAKMVVGSLLRICPVLNVNRAGELTPQKNIRTKRRAMEELVRRMEENADNGLQYDGKCYICQSAVQQDAREVTDMIEARFPHMKGKVVITWIGAVIGAHTGPGTIALFFTGKERME